MTDDPRDRDTTPAPSEGNVGEQISELLLALQSVGERMAQLGTTLMWVQIAQRAGEHRLNVQRANHISERRWLVDLERRTRVLEELADTAAE